MIKLVLKLGVVSLLLTTTSCSKKPNIDDSKVFRINRYDNVSSLDPAFARNKSNNWITNQIYNGLVDFDNDLNIVPSIAKNWTIDKSGMVYIFHLDTDIQFHKHPIFGEDSTRFVIAEDFVHSFNRLKDPQLGSSGSFVLNNVSGYKAINDSTFQINLSNPFPPFLGLLCMKYCSVVPHELYSSNSQSNDIIGTGPFQYQYWEDNVKLVLKRNRNYFEKDSIGNRLPYLDYINITFLPEKYGEFLKFLNGELDLLSSLDKSYKDELLTSSGELREKYTNEFNLIKSPYLNTEYICFYQGTKESIPKDLREVISLSIDKEKLIKFIRNGIGYPGYGGFIPKGLLGYQPNITEYNPSKAKEVLDSYLSQNDIQEITLVSTQEYAEACEFIQSEVAKVGLSIKVNIVDPATLRDGKANGKFEFFRANWGADYPDAENFLSLFYSKNYAPSGPNYSHFNSIEFDKLYEKSLKASDLKERILIYKQLDSIVINELPVIPVFYDQSVTFIQKNVKGYRPNAIDMINLKYISKTE